MRPSRAQDDTEDDEILVHRVAVYKISFLYLNHQKETFTLVGRKIKSLFLKGKGQAGSTPFALVGYLLPPFRLVPSTLE